MNDAKIETIRLKGARQNNLKGFDLEIPVGKLVVVTGLSGAGKSSLVFETLHAEGQRRYVETFSPYTRQFLELLPEAAIDSIENVRPSIAVKQGNTVRTSRSTVGTMTELCDWMKIWFARAATLFDPATGKPLRADSPATIWNSARQRLLGKSVIVAFPVERTKKTAWGKIIAEYAAGGFTKFVAAGKLFETDNAPDKEIASLDKIFIVADRLKISEPERERFIEAAGSALRLGAGTLALFTEENPAHDNLHHQPATTNPAATLTTNPILATNPAAILTTNPSPATDPAATTNPLTTKPSSTTNPSPTTNPLGEPEIFTEKLVSPTTRKHFRPASPALFSFNSPLGACPKCRGFGRVIELDWKKIIPDDNKTLDEGVFAPFSGAIYGESQRDLLRECKRHKIPTNVPWKDLPAATKRFVIEGDADWTDDDWQRGWYGVRRFFDWLESSLYKMHVRIFISRFRAYVRCPDCGGTRFAPESLAWKFRGCTLPELYAKSVDELWELLKTHGADNFPRDNKAATTAQTPEEIALAATLARLGYLREVGLGFLTLDRQSRTLSGGEVQRVNLTACLGASLANTLFILDEPSVGLHARDLAKMISILKKLVAAGNTVVVVEHDESVMRAADFIVEIGPKPGALGGNLVYAGDFRGILQCENSITGAWLSGRKKLPESVLPKLATTEAKPRKTAGKKSRIVATTNPISTTNPIATTNPTATTNPFPKLRLAKVFAHNLKNFACDIPLKKLVGLCGVSGSGKSTLINNVLAEFASERPDIPAEDDFVLPPCEFSPDIALEKIVLVDQSPLSKTPRSNPALYSGAWKEIRELLASTPQAISAGLTSASFSYNSGDGRCTHCGGSGWETVEMQFLSDVFIPCPVCEGRRFRAEILKFGYNGKNASEILAMTISEAIEFFRDNKKIVKKLALLDEIGLGYLTLGQPLNTLSGGEAQRLKLVKFLDEIADDKARDNKAATTLLLLDEPTTGLHRDDVARLLLILRRLVAAGNSIVVVEHQTDVLRACDWLLELGPEGGDAGGKLVFSGTPRDLARGNTATAPFLRDNDADCCHHQPDCYHDNLPPPTLTTNPPPQTRHHQPDGDSHHQPGGNNGDDAATTMPREALAIRLRGVREHNLKNVSLDIPLNEFAVVTGLSGSGKSSLAFDVVFAEGQRRFMECMSAYARQFVEQLPRPDADEIDGIPPTVAIEQRITRGSAKSTVATITEVAQYLRLLFSKIGVMHNPRTGTALVSGSVETVAGQISEMLKSRSDNGKFLLAAPLIRSRKGHHKPIAEWAEKHGFQKVRADGKLVETRNFAPLDRYKEHDIEVIVCELSRKIAESESGDRDIFNATNRALELGKGACAILDSRGKMVRWFSRERIDPKTGESFPELEPKDFSWSSPRGWCPECHGHGRVVETWGAQEGALNEDALADVVSRKICPACGGARLNPLARAVTISAKIPAKKSAATSVREFSLPQLLALPPADLLAVLGALDLGARERAIAARVIPEIRSRLQFLGDVGLSYLALDRASDTLSGGEAQRIRLAAQLGSNLSGALYVLDEPSIGLHPSDNERLIGALKNLRARGNSLLVVEHDEDTMRAADRVIDLGPGAGTQGGEVLFNGKISEAEATTKTLQFLANGIPHPLNGKYRQTRGCGFIELRGAALRNLKGGTAKFPIGRLSVVCGVSGAGKSTLVSDLLAPTLSFAATKRLKKLSGALAFKEKIIEDDTGKPVFKELLGGDNFRKVVVVSQDPIGKTSRSTPATYVGAFDLIRQIFAELPEAKIRGYTASTFSFNTKGGRCETCAGAGRIKLEMNFMPDASVVCETCAGTRYSTELSEIRWNGKNIAEVLEMTFSEAVEFFAFHKKLQEICALMAECGLGYLTLGQSSPMLSGGESQRLKLVSELVGALPSWKERVGKTRAGAPTKNCYILEEPTIGLHQADCVKLLALLHRLVDEGHTVIVVEHHLDIIAEADWTVEIGPVGGNAGGEIICQGPVANLLACKNSPTAPFLKKVMP